MFDRVFVNTVINISKGEKEEDMSYLVLQLETGLMDGFYGSMEDAENAMETWNDRYPHLNHAVSVINPPFDKGYRGIPDRLFLPVQYYKNDPQEEEINMERILYDL